MLLTIYLILVISIIYTNDKLIACEKKKAKYDALLIQVGIDSLKAQDLVISEPKLLNIQLTN